MKLKIFSYVWLSLYLSRKLQSSSMRPRPKISEVWYVHLTGIRSSLPTADGAAIAVLRHSGATENVCGGGGGQAALDEDQLHFSA